MFDNSDYDAMNIVARYGDDYENRDGICRCRKCELVSRALRHLDLSPLARFVGRPARLDTVMWFDTTSGQLVRRVSPVWDYYGTPGQTAPEPEKSPADRALDEFIAKRKAKRERPDLSAESARRDMAATEREEKQGQAIDRALSRAYVHHTEVTERLAPYRVVL